MPVKPHKIAGNQGSTNYLNCAEAAKLCPGRPHLSTLWRWMRQGCVARNGQQVRLRHVRVGRHLFTKEIWLNEFFNDLAATDCDHWPGNPEPAATAPRRRTERRRQRDLQAAEARLAKAGI